MRLSANSLERDISEFSDISLDEIENGSISSDEIEANNVVVTEDTTHNFFLLFFVSFLIGFGSFYYIYKIM